MPQQSSPSSTRKARRKAQPMTESRLLSAIDYRESRSEAGDLFEEEQRKALRYYFGEPIGGEDPDRSQIVMREVYSVIEWIKPMLMKVFFGSKRKRDIRTSYMRTVLCPIRGVADLNIQTYHWQT